MKIDYAQIITADDARSKAKADARANAAMTKAAFCNGMADLSVLTDAEAIAGAQGKWPESMVEFLDYLDPRQRRDAQIEFAACDTIQRLHPFVLTLASWLGLDDAIVDEMFGVAAPEIMVKY